MKEGEDRKICLNCVQYKPNATDDTYGRCKLHRNLIMMKRWDDYCVNWGLDPDVETRFDPNEQANRDAILENRAAQERQERRRNAIFPDLYD